MIKVITVDSIKKIAEEIGIENFIKELIGEVHDTFARWHDFQKSPRHATYFKEGVIELMPIADEMYYACKLVNGHPNNPHFNKPTVAALGFLVESSTGIPLLISAMTLLTAFRTAATSALASRYLSKKNPKKLAIIGNGAQSEFQVLAHKVELGIEQVSYFDIDPDAMKKFAKNLSGYGLALRACSNSEEAVKDADIVITATASKKRNEILDSEWIKPGMHINAIGGDSPDKTELPVDLLERSKIVVEYLPQSLVEGEIQQKDVSFVYAELWELVTGKKAGRETNQEITLFDSVGFALEDYAALCFMNKLTERNEFKKYVQHINFIPDPKDTKNLFGIL